MRYVIIGGGGFLGQHVVHFLLKQLGNNDQIRIIDKIPSLEKNKIIYPETFADPRVEFYWNTDISDKNNLPKLLENTNVVLHLASAILYGKRNQYSLHDVNVKTVEHVIHAAKLNKTEKMIYVSSFATIGCLDHQDKNQLAGEDCENDWKKETYCYYGLSKYHAEQQILRAADETLKVAVALPGIMLGPGPAHHASSLPFDTVKKRKWIAVPQGGSNYIDVRDVAHGLIKLATHKNVCGKYLFVSNNIEHRELLSEIAKIWQRKVRILTIPKYFSHFINYGTSLLEWMLPKESPFSREGIVKAFKYRYFTYQKAAAEMGWSPQYSLQQTLQDTYLWLDGQQHD